MSRCVPAVVVCMKACEGKEREVVRIRKVTQRERERDQIQHLITLRL